MALSETNQILEAMKRSRNPLICIPRGTSSDAYVSAIALSKLLEKLEKPYAMLIGDETPPKNLDFLLKNATFQKRLENLRQLIIELDAQKTAVDELQYEIEDGKLSIYLSPKNGAWEEKDVRIKTSAFKHDLIITIGATDLSALGTIFEQHSDFFYHTPVINIDHKAENEHFGSIDAVDITVSSCAEIVYDLITEIDGTILDEELATLLLAGMIANTNSFKVKRVSPKSLQTASKLMDIGADRNTIVEQLYRTRSIETLRLWGRALARLKSDKASSVVWSLLSKQDFLHAGAEEEDLADVIEELISSSPEAKLVALLYEDKDGMICAEVQTDRPLDAMSICSPWSPAGTRDRVQLFFPKKTIVQVERMLIPHLREQVKNLLK